MRQRWPWAARAASIPAGDDGRWGVARLVAEREAAARSVIARPDPVALRPEAVPAALAGPDRGPAVGSVPDEAAPDEAGRDKAVQDKAAPDDSPPDDSPPDDSAADATEDEPDGPAEPAADPAPAPRRPVPVTPPHPRTPLPAPPPPLPRPRRPQSARPVGFDERLPRPRVEPDLSLFGFARHTRGRVGSRLFRLFFLLVFALIVIQTIASIV